MLKWLLLFCVLILVFWRLLRPKQPSVAPKRHVTYGFRRPQNVEAISYEDQDALADREQDAALDQLRFDQVAALLFERKINSSRADAAETLQYLILNKMPAQCLSHINQHELGEWSIYWSYKQQSLEYYVARYGVFYSHVDRYGQEHKMQLTANRLASAW